MAYERPFLTADFSHESGGIDFLGLRWVGLTIVGRYLVPELNNVTRDMGTFFLGTWIPWKFRKLCLQEKQYSEKNYRVFREKIEVGLSLTLRADSNLERASGELRNKIGNTQRCLLPASLNFKDARRKVNNSLFGAAVYGPALQAFDLIRSYRSLIREGTDPIRIPVVSDDPETKQIAEGVEHALGKSSSFRLLDTIDSPEFNWQDVKSLGECGLDPASFRRPEFKALKSCFRRRLLPASEQDPGYGRTLTARLLLQTLDQVGPISSPELREVWYTGLMKDSSKLHFNQREMQEQHLRWSCFMARQHQRYAIEIFLWVFENGLKEGLHSIEAIVDYWIKRSNSKGNRLKDSFDSILRHKAGSLWKDDDLATSRSWNSEVTRWHSSFEYVEAPKDDFAVCHALEMLAGWYWRMLSRQDDPRMKELMSLGGSDRMGMSWFLGWLKARRKMPMKELLREIFSNLVFSQHMRVALARFDGSSQRLRFLLGERGIEATTSATEDLGDLLLPWMPDRLDTLIDLLCDCDVLAIEQDEIIPSPSAIEAQS